LLACNHVSFVDAMIVAAACWRPVRFIMYHKIFSTPIMRFVFRTSRAIAPRKEDEALMHKAFDDVAAALQSGDVVWIFPEGLVTHTGDINEFRNGIEKIVERTPVPVIALVLKGLWGSFFSRQNGTAMNRPKRLVTRFWSRIKLVAGLPLPAEDVTADRLESAVRELRGDTK
jgi:1-acyl-sn-glycerol-3-phosphate acyltransferase